MEFAVRGLLNRSKALMVREVVSDIYVHPENDPGCLLHGHDFLRSFVNRYAHALVILDREGCGQERFSRETLESNIEERLSQTGWDHRAAAIVIDPELEVWVWSDSPHVDSVLGWEGKQPDLRSWLIIQGFSSSRQIKPNRPKEAVQEALRLVRKQRSSSLYLQLAEKVSLDRCFDRAFIKFKMTLNDWFSEEEVPHDPHRYHR
jgi:hypothetical protein